MEAHLVGGNISRPRVPTKGHFPLFPIKMGNDTNGGSQERERERERESAGKISDIGQFSICMVFQSVTLSLF